MHPKTNELHMQYEYIRRTGRTNMLDRVRVGIIAAEHDFLLLGNTCLVRKEYSLLLNTFRQPSNGAFHHWCDQKGLEKI